MGICHDYIYNHEKFPIFSIEIYYCPFFYMFNNPTCISDPLHQFKALFRMVVWPKIDKEMKRVGHRQFTFQDYMTAEGFTDMNDQGYWDKAAEVMNKSFGVQVSERETQELHIKNTCTFSGECHYIKTRPSRPTMRPLRMNVFYE